MNDLNNLLGMTGWTGIGSVALTALFVFVLLRLTGVVKPDQAVYQLPRILKFTAEAPVRLAIRPMLWLLYKIPSAKRLAEALWSKLTDESLQRFFDRRFRNSESPLLRGDIEAVARLRYPEARWPHLYMADIPEDLQRPLVVDGRLIDGSSPASLAPAFVDTVLVGQAYRRAVLAAIFWAFVGVLAWHPQLYFGKTLKGTIEQAETNTRNTQAKQRANGERDGNLPYLTMGVKLNEDAWDLQTINTKLREQADMQQKVMESRRDAIISSAPNGLITVVLFTILVFLGTWRGLVRDAAQQKVEPLRRQNKEAIIQWKYRLPERDIQYRAYLAQLKVVREFDKSPLIEIGKASGLFRFRGQLSAPEQRTIVRMSLMDMMQHLLLLGGTGEGKTRSIILPVVKQILTLRANYAAEGNPRAMSLYCTDGKAVLWRDIKAAAEKVGQGGDVRVIGCNESSGEYGVDLLEGVNPQLLADIISSVMRQSKGASSDGGDIWPDAAALVI
ncbi:hypothetical protein ACEU07_20905, partial [Chromobacterium violaceum]|uniref:hypothetical protein n=1 Tax=Chromobacterium violaceum TaxID=536 RepID=UPI0035A6085C